METPLGAIHSIDLPGTNSFSLHLLSPHHSLQKVSSVGQNDPFGIVYNTPTSCITCSITANQLWILSVTPNRKSLIHQTLLHSLCKTLLFCYSSTLLLLFIWILPTLQATSLILQSSCRFSNYIMKYNGVSHLIEECRPLLSFAAMSMNATLTLSLLSLLLVWTLDVSAHCSIVAF